MKIIPSESLEANIEYETKNLVQKQNKKCKNYPSMQMIVCKKKNLNKRFSFYPVLQNEILKQIKNLDTKKVIQQNDVLTTFLKQNFYFHFKFLP